MSVDGVRGDEELVGDLPVGRPVRGKVGDHQLRFGQCLPPGLRPVHLGGTPSHAETAKPAPDARSVPARPGARRNRQRRVEHGDCRSGLAAFRQHPAEVFERGRLGKRAGSASIERSRALQVICRVGPDAPGVRCCRGAGRDLRIEARASFGDRDSVFRELLVSGRGSDPHAFGVVGDLVRVKREHRQPLLLPAGAEPPVRLHRIALGKREKREVPHRVMADARRPGLQHGLRDLGNLQRA
jgi:hypothetical protein